MYDPIHTRVQFLEAVARRRVVKRYLEIGVQDRKQCFDHIEAEHKVGVDPNDGGATHIMTSDQFFASLAPTDVFDLIFVDGDHNHQQVAKDTDNALEHLAPGGLLVMHDCMPPTKDYENPSLCGTAWRAFQRLRHRPDIDAVCGEFDVGVGVIRRGANDSPIADTRGMDELRYEDMVANSDAWMRPRSFADALRFACLGARVPCFWCDPLPEAEETLRRYASGACAGGVHYHNAGIVLGTAPWTADFGGSGADDVPHDDARWPRKCDSCAYVFSPDDHFQHNFDQRYARADGTGSRFTLQCAPMGAMWNATWYGPEWAGPDGKSLVLMLPDGTDWTMDCPSRDGKPWTREGTPPLVTVRPSILTPGYHGVLTDGILVEC